MIDKYTAQAPTKDQAIEKGLKALGVTREEAVVEVTNHGKKGFLGIGQKDAVVIVKRQQTDDIMEDVLSRGVPRDKEKSESEAVKPDTMDKEQTPKENQDKEEDKSSDSHSDDLKESKDTSEEEYTEKETKESSKEQVDKNKVQDEEGIEAVKHYMEDIIKKMGVEDAVIDVKHQNKRVQYDVRTKEAGLVIGRHGKVLNGLQTLAQIQLHQQADSKLYARVDAENYRGRRKKTVEQLAHRTADKVKHTNRPVILEPMPPHERKQIHRFLNDYSHVQTHSEGKEPHRYLVIEPLDKT